MIKERVNNFLFATRHPYRQRPCRGAGPGRPAIAARIQPQAKHSLFTMATLPTIPTALPTIPIHQLKKLPRRFYARDTLVVAHELLGKLLVHRIDGEKRIGRIVEVEAYLGPTDLAAHTSTDRTARPEAMFGPPGHVSVSLVDRTSTR